MKKTFTKIFVAACAVALACPCAEAGATDTGSHRQMYGWFLRSGKYGNGHYGYASINMSEPSDYEFIYSYDMKSSIGQYAGAAVDGIFYGCEYDISNVMLPPVPAAFVRYNIFTGVREEIGEWDSGDNLIDINFRPLDMTYDYKNSTMYALGYLGGNTTLYTVDLNTGRFTEVVDLSDSVQPLAADANGDLYTVTLDGWLCKINKNNGNLTQIFNTGRPIFQNSPMEFDLTTGKLYWASNMVESSLSSRYTLMEIDLSDESDVVMTEVGLIDEEGGVHALYIPYAEGGLDVPAAPTDIRVETLGDGALRTRISWTDPVTTFNGDPLTDAITGAVIYRNGEEIGFVKGSESNEFLDEEITTAGECRYDVAVISTAGTGAKGTAYAYVGEDLPAAVKNLTLTPAPGCGSVTISWDAVTEGAHGGLFSKPGDVTYTVTRKPDNVVVASGIKDTQATDSKIVRILKYTYEVKAENEIGATVAAAEPIILGPAKELPYEQYFYEEADVDNSWTRADGNGDGFTWMFDTTLGTQFFNSYEIGFEYAVSPTQGLTEDADEWLITPPFKFEAGTEYELAIFNRSASEEILQLHVADTNIPAAMGEKYGADVVLPAFQYGDFDQAANCIRILTQVVPLPVFDTETVKCIGLHLVTPMPEFGNAFLQINGIGVAEKGTYAGVSNVAVDADIRFNLQGRMLHVGDGAATTVYTLAGAEVLGSAAADIDLSGLTAGVYIVRVTAGNNSSTAKVVLK